MKTLARFLLLGLASCLTTGCVTSELWDSNYSRIHEPALPLNLRLYQSTEKDDVLVQYHEWVDVNEKVRTRTYWLNRNSRLVSNPHKPKFISARTAEGLVLIPLLDSPPSFAGNTGQMSAVRVNSPPGFVLYSDNRELGRYALPVYDDATGTAIKVLLTPLAITADAAIITGYLYLLYWSGGRTDLYQ